jgi:hypothetical protein
MDREDEMAEVDPLEFTRAVLGISPEDAAKVREDTPGTRKQPSAAQLNRCRSVHGSNRRCELQAGHKRVHEARIGPGDYVRWTHNLT